MCAILNCRSFRSSTTLNGGDVFLAKNSRFFDLHFEFSPLPDTSGRGWGWGAYGKTHTPPLNAVLPISSGFTVPLPLFRCQLYGENRRRQTRVAAAAIVMTTSASRAKTHKCPIHPVGVGLQHDVADDDLHDGRQLHEHGYGLPAVHHRAV